MGGGQLLHGVWSPFHTPHVRHPCLTNFRNKLIKIANGKKTFQSKICQSLFNCVMLVVCEIRISIVSVVITTMRAKPQHEGQQERGQGGMEHRSGWQPFNEAASGPTKGTAYQNEAKENDYILQSKEIILIKYSKYIKGSENKHIML